MQTIYLDISNKGVIPTIYAKQGDVGRKFQVVLTDEGVPYYPADGSAFSVWYSGASGEGNYTEVGDKSAFSVSGNKVTVEMISQMLSNDGEGILSLVLNDPNGNQISTWNIHYVCEYVPGAGSQEAKAYYTAFSQAVENLPYPDASLSVSGKAADAAATGKALAGKAPAGYGLGVESKMLTAKDDLNNIKANGWYGWYMNDAPANAPVEYAWSNFQACRVWTLDGGVCLQEIVELGYDSQVAGVKVQRTIYGETAQPWELENPPMTLGEEYRTTERWNGKPVYAKCVNFGALPNTEEKIVYHEIAGVDKIVYASATAWVGNEVMIMNSNTYYIIDFKAGQNSVAIRTNADMTSWTNCVFTLKYTKN